MRPGTSAPGRTATTSTEPAGGPNRDIGRAPAGPTLEALRAGTLEVLGWLAGSSNNAMVVRVWPPAATEDRGRAIDPGDLLAVWKPTVGERPLFDFPIGTLTRREVAAFHLSEALGWAIVPPTLLRDGPGGEGMLQAWIDVDPAADVIALVNGDDPRLRRVAVFDAIANNTDRKAGHVLPVADGHLFVVDHGVTFSTVPKLRTVLWAWAGDEFDTTELAGIARVRGALGTGRAPGALGVALHELLASEEVEATRARVAALLASGRFPNPSPDWPAIPWPPV